MTTLYPHAIGFTNALIGHPRGGGYADWAIRDYARKRGYSLWQVFTEQSPIDGADSNPHQRFRCLIHEIYTSDRPTTVIVVDLMHLGVDNCVREWRLRMLRWVGATVLVVPEEDESESGDFTLPDWLVALTPIYSEVRRDLVGQGAG